MCRVHNTASDFISLVKVVKQNKINKLDTANAFFDLVDSKKWGISLKDFDRSDKDFKKKYQTAERYNEMISNQLIEHLISLNGKDIFEQKQLEKMA